ncbi:ABC transporter permease [Terasakiispira papahanaumokuakeensis]|uniref:ABC transporter permease n=1 Tax=Terasakiispira papahanaumokuakeensis TaxID=197479 RepID=A0A1E2V8D5_9GAMM|nr:amino acid ABC transporter permease [Terasakiispira papahanaumokuakeensis]ODC03183.1 ABC transporter permease [Terasakiispira papahanaumokuakeensis]
MTNWDIVWDSRDLLWQGFLNTLSLFSVAIALAFLLGCLIVYRLEDPKTRWRLPLRSFIDIMRMLPFLVLVYLLYYGLPSAGIRLEAWWAGLIGLTFYHGAYFAEILRGCRVTLSNGQIEAAYAHGFTPSRMFIRLILPQLMIQARPLIGNQLVYALKDTAFLFIITVKDLTWAANSISATYFVPTEAFVAVIGFYWLISLVMEMAIRYAGRFGHKRGFDHV